MSFFGESMMLLVTVSVILVFGTAWRVSMIC